MAARLRVTLRKSAISHKQGARGTLRALGLRRIGQTVELPDNDVSRGMVRAVRFLVEAEPFEGTAATSPATKPPTTRSSPSPTTTGVEEKPE
jgi:large subunit ribosomal protein L30